ncbi:MAG: hypothetical protein ACR2IK_10300 [Chloroflexota bacterium]
MPLTPFSQVATVDPAATDSATTAAAANPAVSDPSITDPTMRRIAELEGQRTQALTIVSSTDPSVVSQKRVAQATIAKLEPQLSAAYRDAAANERAAAKVAQVGGAGGSTPAQMLQAAAATARADAMTTKADAYAEGTSNKRAQLEADARLKDAQAAEAKAKADIVTSTSPDAVNAAHVALTQAQASLQSTQQDNITKGLNNDVLSAKAATAVPTAEAELAGTQAKASSLGSQAQIDSANAANAVAASAAGLSKSPSDAGKAQTNYQDALANFNALTPEMRTQAAQDALATKRTALDQAQQNLQFAQDAHQTNLQQGQATLAETQAKTQAGLLGPLYGAQQKVAEIQAMLKSGTLTDPAQAQQMLLDYTTSAMRGTTPYQQQQDALATETARRTQDATVSGQQASLFGTLGDQAQKNFSDMNKWVQPGSDVGGRAYLAMMGMASDAARGFGLPANQGGGQNQSPLLQSMSTAGGVAPQAPATGGTPPSFAEPASWAAARLAAQPPAAAPAAPQPAATPAAPTTTIAPDGSVTIQHTPAVPTIGPTPTIPLLGPDQAGMGGDPSNGGSQTPAFLSGMGLAMPHHVDALWANDPNLSTSGWGPAGR